MKPEGAPVIPEPSFRHCDDYINSPSEPECLRRFLLIERLPATEKLLLRRVPLFAKVKEDTDFRGKVPQTIPAGTLVRVVMASRMGDVGITDDITADHGYRARVAVEDLHDFADELPDDRKPELREIQIHFALPVVLSRADERTIFDIVSRTARKFETADTVHWLAGSGSGHNADLSEFDDSVWSLECTARARRESEPWEGKPTDA